MAWLGPTGSQPSILSFTEYYLLLFKNNQPKKGACFFVLFLSLLLSSSNTGHSTIEVEKSLIENRPGDSEAKDYKRQHLQICNLGR